MKFAICGNNETLVDGYTNDELAHVEEDAAVAYVEAAAKVLDNAGADYKVESKFSDWRGGKFADQAAMYGYRKCGRVCCLTDADDAEKIGDAADEAGIAAMEAVFASEMQSSED